MFKLYFLTGLAPISASTKDSSKNTQLSLSLDASSFALKTMVTEAKSVLEIVKAALKVKLSSSFAVDRDIDDLKLAHSEIAGC